MANASRSVVDQFCSVAENVFEATATIFFLPHGVSCIKIAPQALSDASVVRLKGRLKSGNEMIGLEVSFFLIFKKASSASVVHSNGTEDLLR